MTNETSFKDRVAALRFSKNLTDGFNPQDARLVEMEAVWEPLVSHMKALAKEHLPPEKSLSITMSLRDEDRFKIQIKLLDHTDPKHTKSVDSIEFINHSNPKIKKLWHGYSSNLPDLDPDNMEAAQSVLETWLGTQIALDFDQSRIYPTSTLEVVMKRSGKPPENTP